MKIDKIENGYVLDHISAGSGMKVYDCLLYTSPSPRD